MALDDDHYGILGVDPDADEDTLRRAFRRRVRACHPDRLAGLDVDLRRLAEEKMVRLNRAYHVLGDGRRRAAYDNGRRTVVDTMVRTDPAPAPSRGVERRGQTAADADLVLRAAVEEFTRRLRTTATRHSGWRTVPAPGARVAWRARRGPREEYFVLGAGRRLDQRTLGRSLVALLAWARGLPASWWGDPRVYPFVGALDLEDAPAMRRRLERFNRRHAGEARLGEATLLDIGDWQAGPEGLSSRLRRILTRRGR